MGAPAHRPRASPPAGHAAAALSGLPLPHDVLCPLPALCSPSQMTGAAQEKGSQVRWCRAWLEPVPPGWPTCRSTAMRGCGRSFNRMMGADVHTHQSVQGQSRPGRRLPAPRQAHTSSSWSGPRLPGPWQARAAHAKACEHAVAQAGEVLTSLKTYEPAVAQAGEGLAAIHAFVAVEHYTGGQVCRPGGGHAASCPAALPPAARCRHTLHIASPPPSRPQATEGPGVMEQAQVRAE